MKGSNLDCVEGLHGQPHSYEGHLRNIEVWEGLQKNTRDVYLVRNLGQLALAVKDMAKNRCCHCFTGEGRICLSDINYEANVMHILY